MRRKALILLSGVLTLCPAYSAQEAPERQPNIVYVMADELGYYELSHMGSPYIKTPRIDELAAGGMRFTQALAGSSLCAPTRCVLMTGSSTCSSGWLNSDGSSRRRR